MSVQLITEHQRKPKRFTPQQKLQVLKEWELSGNGVEVAQKYQIHPHNAVSLEKGPGARGRDLSEWEAEQGRPEDKAAGRREPQAEGGPCHSDPGVDVAKKDELGGCVLKFVENLKWPQYRW